MNINAFEIAIARPAPSKPIPYSLINRWHKASTDILPMIYIWNGILLRPKLLKNLLSPSLSENINRPGKYTFRYSCALSLEPTG